WNEVREDDDRFTARLFETPSRIDFYLERRLGRYTVPLTHFKERVLQTDPSRVYDLVVPIKGPRAYGRKFLDLAVYVHHDLERVFFLGLDARPSMKILDIGSGPGFFCYGAQLCGHHAVAMERPTPETGHPTVSFPALLRFFGVPHTLQKLQANERIAWDS